MTGPLVPLSERHPANAKYVSQSPRGLCWLCSSAFHMFVSLPNPSRSNTRSPLGFGIPMALLKESPRTGLWNCEEETTWLLQSLIYVRLIKIIGPSLIAATLKLVRYHFLTVAEIVFIYILDCSVMPFICMTFACQYAVLSCESSHPTQHPFFKPRIVPFHSFKNVYHPFTSHHQLPTTNKFQVQYQAFPGSRGLWHEW